MTSFYVTVLRAMDQQVEMSYMDTVRTYDSPAVKRALALEEPILAKIREHMPPPFGSTVEQELALARVIEPMVEAAYRTSNAVNEYAVACKQRGHTRRAKAVKDVLVLMSDRNLRWYNAYLCAVYVISKADGTPIEDPKVRGACEALGVQTVGELRARGFLA